MSCGHIETLEDGNLRGAFLSWAHPRIDFAFRVNKDRSSDKSPSHTVIAKNPHGAWCDIGSAWTNKITNGAKAGQSFYSLKLDEQTLFGGQVVELVAWPESDSKSYTLEYSKERQEQAA